MNPTFREYMELIKENENKGHDELVELIRKELLKYAGKELEEAERQEFLANPIETLKVFCRKGEVKKVARVLYNLYEAKESFEASEKEINRTCREEVIAFSTATHYVRNRLTDFLSYLPDAPYFVIREAKSIEERESLSEKLGKLAQTLSTPSSQKGRVYFSVINPFFLVTQYLADQGITFLPAEIEALREVAATENINFDYLKKFVEAVQGGEELGETIGNPKAIGSRIAL